MTVKLIAAPQSSSSYWFVASNVKSVSQTEIIYHNGYIHPKKLSTKVEILSIMDAPEDWDEAERFFIDLGCSKYCEIRERLISKTSGYIKMTSDQFSALDLPKFI